VKHTKLTQPRTIAPKQDTSQTIANNPLWKERQLRDYRKSHDLCYYCVEKFQPHHLEKYTKKTKPQINALVVNAIGVDLTEETLNQLVVEDVLTKEMG
jgi:hypothetical protein